MAIFSLRLSPLPRSDFDLFSFFSPDLESIRAATSEARSAFERLRLTFLQTDLLDRVLAACRPSVDNVHDQLHEEASLGWLWLMGDEAM
jgi:hypothetical protein